MNVKKQTKKQQQTNTLTLTSASEYLKIVYLLLPASGLKRMRVGVFI
jgi:hypothetical protein